MRSVVGFGYMMEVAGYMISEENMTDEDNESMLTVKQVVLDDIATHEFLSDEGKKAYVIVRVVQAVMRLVTFQTMAMPVETNKKSTKVSQLAEEMLNKYSEQEMSDVGMEAIAETISKMLSDDEKQEFVDRQDPLYSVMYALEKMYMGALFCTRSYGQFTKLGQAYSQTKKIISDMHAVGGGEVEMNTLMAQNVRALETLGLLDPTISSEVKMIDTAYLVLFAQTLILPISVDKGEDKPDIPERYETPVREAMMAGATASAKEVRKHINRVRSQ